MKKDKEWLKEEVKKLKTIHGDGYDEYTKNGSKYDHAFRMVLELIEELDKPEQEKVVVPKFVDDWIETMKQQDFTLGQVAEHLYSGDIKWSLLTKYERWARLNFTKFTRAWLDGYSVEKKRKYVVEDNKVALLCKFDGKVMPVSETIQDGLHHESLDYELTETEIKDYDERYWAFAEEITK